MTDVRRDWAIACAGQIVNLLGQGCPGGKCERYSQIFRPIMNVMMLADEECAERWKTPSNN